MPQETNLNVAPYFDDFDPQSNYYKVLFKPGYPVQARELNNLQSILQNQVEDVGDHLFKEGSCVIPGGTVYTQNFYCIQIQEEFLGVPVGLYLDQLVGNTITGRDSGVTAKVVTYITNEQSERGNYTLYLNYIDSAFTDAATQTFFDNEVLVTNVNINYATTFISAGEGFANTLTTNASAAGSAFSISDGVYFLRGYFVDVQDETIILEQYSNTPSVRIGLEVNENIVSADVDPTLTDNAQGFNNFSAPGADRFEITAKLTKKPLGDFNDTNFVQLSEIQSGILRTEIKTEYNKLGDALAKRTNDESGSYYIRQFTTTIKESLNDNEGNRGIYQEGQRTASGAEPSDDLLIYRVSPGRAYVEGYEVDIRTSSLIDVPKPRTTRLLQSQSINFGFGPTFEVNNVHGSATIGFNTSNTLSLRDQRVVTDGTASGKEIGLARIYDFVLESGSYDTSNPDTNKWDLSLFDVQTYTDITLNEPVTLSVPTFVRGQSSGSIGFVRYAVSAGTGVTVYNVQGDFSIGENLFFNGVDVDSRFVTDVREYGNSDIQSVYGIVGSANTFTADIIPQPNFVIGNATLTPGDTVTGVSTVTNPSTSFVGIATVGNLVRYTTTSSTVPTLGRITVNNSTSIEIVGVTTVSGVCEGAVPTSLTSVNDFTILSSKIQKNLGSGNESTNQTLYSIFPKKNISSVDLSDSNLVIRRQFDTSISSNNETPVIDADPNESFLPFDEERYILIRSDGTTEALTRDKVVLTNGSTSIQFIGLSGSDTSGTVLIATLKKAKVTSKVKRKSISNNLIIDKSKNSSSGTNVSFAGTTIGDGLTYGNYPFGTRVQDSVISLNVPDVVEIHDIFEASGTEDPESPNMTTASMDGPTATTNDLIIGETITGTVSGAKAIYLVRKTDTSIGFCYLNNTSFEPNEVVQFSQSGVSALASDVSVGSRRVTDQYSFFNGQNESIYDYSRIIRKPGFPEANRKLRVYYSKGFYDSSDTGDITTVNSYNSFDYSKEINTTDGVRDTDIIDVRPRVKDYTVTIGGRSPLEFYGRDFDSGSEGQHSSKYVIASDESITLDYNYYLPRADRVYVGTDGNFFVKFGTPDDTPKLPEEVSGALHIANVYLPAYTYNLENVKVEGIQHKRYQMRDIFKLEQRIKNLEYYSSLSLIETNTLNLFVPDSNGLNRFKSGIYIDNFSELKTQDTSIGVRNSIDTKKRVLRPSHYTTAISLEVGSDAITGIGTTTIANQDNRFANLDGINVIRKGQTVFLNYTSVNYASQPFATRSQNVTPFLVQFWNGSIVLEPDVDVWVDTNRMQARTIEVEGSFEAIASALGAEITTANDGTRIGVTPVQWDSWETVGINVLNFTREERGRRNLTQQEELEETGRNTRRGSTADVTTVSSEVAISQQRTGSQSTVTEIITNESLGDRIVSRDIIHFIRTRNIEFTGTRLKPFTEVYAFFDDVPVSNFCHSKLLEITMDSGTFEVGETVEGEMIFSDTAQRIDMSTIPRIKFRVATANHKYGPYNDPTDVYDSNPYDRTNTLPSTYSETSTILNVDTFSLASENQPEFEGFLREGMIITGQSSGASAIVKARRLVTDRLGTIIGSFRVPDGNNLSNPIFETGSSTFRLTNDPSNSSIQGLASTAADEVFYSEGSIENTQEVTLSLRNARVEVENTFFETREEVSEGTNTIFDNIRAVPPPPPPPPPSFGGGGGGRPAPPRTTVPPPRRGNDLAVGMAWASRNNIPVASSPFRQQVARDFGITGIRWQGTYRDPLAQTFNVQDERGVFLTKVDIFFSSKDENIPITCQIREVQLGTPTSVILPYSEVDVDPKNVNVSTDGSVATTFEFESPVYLEGQKEYAIVLLSNSTEYNVWISRLGEVDVSTIGSEEGQILVSKQPVLGSLFKSQNASTWTPSQFEDLKFNLYRADFVPAGTINFYNPKLPTSLSSIPKDGITIEPRNISVGIGTTIQEPNLVIGNKITQSNSTGSGTLVGYAGSAFSTLTITNSGIGYTPSSGSYTFAGVALTSITGKGINARADIYVEDGIAIGATITTNQGGKGYTVGDVLTPIQVGNSQLGRNMKLSINQLKGNNELVLDEVQGSFDTTNELLYVDTTTGTATTINSSINGTVIPVSPIRVNTDGRHFNIFQRNHGMYSSINMVTLSDIESNVDPTPLTVDYTRTGIGAITVSSTTDFGNFEGVGVGTTNPGYAKIGKEIVKYTGVSGNTLTGITRGVDNTVATKHNIDDLVYKYELDGVSLRRINRTHNLNNVTSSNPITLDTYNVKIDVEDTDYGTNRGTGTDFSELYFNTGVTAGGEEAKGSYNLPFNIMIPKITTIEPKGSNIEFQAKTTAQRSISGTEVAFVDKGFESIANYQKNYFDTPRMIASQINEDTYLSAQPGNKSFELTANLYSFDSRLSPAIDLDNSSIVTITNRVNNPISDYSTDYKVNTVVDDPNRFVYVTKNIILENPASGLKVYLDAYISTYNDVRVFYALNQPDSTAKEVVFVPFPGYSNFDETGKVILSKTASDGSSDLNIPKLDSYTDDPSIDQFREYTFTNEDLPAFSSFRIKIVGTSTNQSVVPQFRNLRAIALA
jgi:hypothetical protein